jgi:hypothetical protein
MQPYGHKTHKPRFINPVLDFETDPIRRATRGCDSAKRKAARRQGKALIANELLH